MVSRKILVGGVSVFVATVMLISAAHAQPGGGRGGQGGFFGGGGFGGGGLAGLLMRQDVRDELELLDSQVDDLRKLAEKRAAEMREMFSGMQDLSREERMQKFQGLREKMQEAQKDAEEELGEVLLPHQQKRLKQLEFQMRMRGGVSRALMNDQIVEEFDITDSQQEKLRDKARELEEQLRKEIAKLRQKAQEELLKELTPQQREQWKEKVGEPFEFEQTQPRFGGGRGGNAPGGARGER